MRLVKYVKSMSTHNAYKIAILSVFHNVFLDFLRFELIPFSYVFYWEILVMVEPILYRHWVTEKFMATGSLRVCRIGSNYESLSG